jgi:hypothetical protein
LLQQSQTRRAMRGLARVSIEGPAGGGRAKQVLLAERPARLRIEFQGFLNQTVALFATDGERFDLFRAEDRSHRSGPVRDGLLFESVQVDLAPEEAVSLLLGDPGPLAGLQVAGPTVRSGSELSLALTDSLGAVRRVLWFDAAARLRAAESRSADGAVEWIARFDDYRDVGDAPFAHSIDLRVPSSGTRAQLGLRDVELNPELPPDIFELHLPTAVSSDGEAS